MNTPLWPIPPEVFLASEYRLSLQVVPVLITLAAVCFLSLYVLTRERQSKIRVPFVWMTVPAAVWFAAFSWMYSSTDESAALWWAHVAYLGVPFLPSTVYSFTVRLLQLEPSRRAAARAGLWYSAFLAAWIAGTPSVIEGVRLFPWGYYPQYSLYAIPYLVFFFGYFGASLWHLLQERYRAASHSQRMRVRHLLSAFTVASVASFDYLPKYGVDLYPFGYVCVLGFIAITADLLVRYRFIDVTPSFAAGTIIETMGDAVLVLDSDDVVRVANSSAARLFDLDPEGVAGLPLYSVSPYFPPRDTSERLRDAGKERRYEVEHRHPDGRTSVVDVSESPILDAMGCVAATVLVLRDTTPMRRVQAELANTAQRLQLLSRGAQEPILELDEFGRFRAVNPAAEELLGVSQSRLSGRIFVMSDLLAPEQAQKVLRAIRNAVEGITEPPFELTLLKPDRSVIRLIAVPAPVRREDRYCGVQILLRRASSDPEAVRRPAE